MLYQLRLLKFISQFYYCSNIHYKCQSKTVSTSTELHGLNLPQKPKLCYKPSRKCWHSNSILLTSNTVCNSLKDFVEFKSPTYFLPPIPAFAPFLSHAKIQLNPTKSLKQESIK